MQRARGRRGTGVSCRMSFVCEWGGVHRGAAGLSPLERFHVTHGTVAMAADSIEICKSAYEEGCWVAARWRGGRWEEEGDGDGEEGGGVGVGVGGGGPGEGGGEEERGEDEEEGGGEGGEVVGEVGEEVGVKERERLLGGARRGKSLF
jgi:hypothetical protein